MVCTPSSTPVARCSRQLRSCRKHPAVARKGCHLGIHRFKRRASLQTCRTTVQYAICEFVELY